MKNQERVMEKSWTNHGQIFCKICGNPPPLAPPCVPLVSDADTSHGISREDDGTGATSGRQECPGVWGSEGRWCWWGGGGGGVALQGLSCTGDTEK